MQGDRAGVSRGHSKRRKLPQGGVVTGNELDEVGRTHPAEGPNPIILRYELAVAAFFSKICCLYFIQLRLDVLWEPPSADPHDRWCGGRG